MDPTRRQFVQLGVGSLFLLQWPRLAWASTAPSCRLSPEQTAGPFYLDDTLLRQDITDGKPGIPLLLQFEALDAEGCRPLSGAALDIWHCDAQGAYSGVGANEGSRFLRGMQITDGAGRVEFRSILPGYYPGRTNHVHLKLHLGGHIREGHYLSGWDLHTGQLYFPEPIVREAMTLPTYRHPGEEWTPQARDYIFRRQQGEDSIATLSQAPTGNGLVARLTLVVTTRAPA
ncbi:intradiol ring-cleavage dioxygenase [Metapseudomonas boanensis]|uniref:Intradiol ring-cleavage dioxygenase n=1 Tax=Metapseudomonas boanensis TaxID=2822138 RepID=A0ABS5XME3_9GAMM|nr:intradiol ring-cleavage dioxygenase [Pseudomonas boanensis]MBT8768230.1 intradiol ring-cleavage dioxygenase [Pseudomonas boanensis]